MSDNTRMRQVWDGEVGHFWVEETERYERMNARFGTALMAAAALAEGERVLDVGCGHGARTLEAGERVGVAGSAQGVDISTPMLRVAEQRAVARGLHHVTFRCADAQTDDLGDAAFESAISQFGVMFFADPERAFANIGRALVDGGRLAFTCWQELGRQQRLMVPVLAALPHLPAPDPDASSWSQAAFSLADPDRIGTLLGRAGFTDVVVDGVVEPEYQGSDVGDVISFMRRTELAQTLFARADRTQAARGWEAVAEALAPFESADGVHLDGAAWLVHARKG